MKIGEAVCVHGYVDEIRKDTIIIRNDGGYFGTVEKEIEVKDRLIDCLLNKAYDNVLDVIAISRAENDDKGYRNACDEIAHIITSFLKPGERE